MAQEETQAQSHDIELQLQERVRELYRKGVPVVELYEIPGVYPTILYRWVTGSDRALRKAAKGPDREEAVHLYRQGATLATIYDRTRVYPNLLYGLITEDDRHERAAWAALSSEIDTSLVERRLEAIRREEIILDPPPVIRRNPLPSAGLVRLVVQNRHQTVAETAEYLGVSVSYCMKLRTLANVGRPVPRLPGAREMIHAERCLGVHPLVWYLADPIMTPAGRRPLSEQFADGHYYRELLGMRSDRIGGKRNVNACNEFYCHIEDKAKWEGTDPATLRMSVSDPRDADYLRRAARRNIEDLGVPEWLNEEELRTLRTISRID